MYELIKVSENDYYIDCPSKIGVVRIGKDEVILIDSGNCRDTAKKVLRVLEENGFKLKAIYNTHSHADHIGGNRYLQEKTGCKIYANGAECTAINYNLTEAAILYGGYPFADIMHKFLYAEKSCCLPLTDDVLPEGFSTVNLAGHYFDMVGFITPDGNAYIGDAVLPTEMIDKHGITYVWNVEGFLNSLETLKTVKAKKFIPSHARVTDSIDELAELNRQNTYLTAEKIIGYCSEKITFDNLLKKVFDAYGIDMTAQQNVLIGGTVRSYLSWCITNKKIGYSFIENVMYYEKI